MNKYFFYISYTEDKRKEMFLLCFNKLKVR